jgi:hypothetical protein
MTHNGITTEELLVKQDYYFVVCVTNNCTAKSERYVLSSGRVDVNDTISHIIIVRSLVGVRLAPEREAFLVHKVWR